jgi:hypothetical protein
VAASEEPTFARMDGVLVRGGVNYYYNKLCNNEGGEIFELKMVFDAVSISDQKEY